MEDPFEGADCSGVPGEYDSDDRLCGVLFHCEEGECVPDLETYEECEDDSQCGYAQKCLEYAYEMYGWLDPPVCV